MKTFTVNWKQLAIVFLMTIAFIFAGRAIAQTDINVNNTNLIRVGGSVTVLANQVVENAQAVGGSVIIESNARVTQSATAIGGNVILKPGARIDGDAYAIGGKVIQSPGATIGGSNGTFDDRYDERGMMGMHQNSFLGMYFFHATFRVFAAIIAAILGIILFQNTPSLIPNLAATVRQYPGQSGLWGIGAIITFVILNIFLAITLIGIPLIPLFSVLISLTSLVGSLGISLFVGQRVINTDSRSILQQFLIGLLIITVLALIPFVGGIVVFATSIFGLGSLLVWKWGKPQPQQSL